jgi:hypothetical protein
VTLEKERDAIVQRLRENPTLKDVLMASLESWIDRIGV